MNGTRETVLAVLLTFMIPHIASAHEFWLQPGEFWWQPMQPTPLSLLVGHGHDSTHSRMPSRRITRFEAMGPGSKSLDLRSKLQLGRAATDMELQFDTAGAYVIVLATDNQARSDLPAERFNDYLRSEGLTPALLAREQTEGMHAEGSERYSRQAKSIVRVGESADQSRVTQAFGLRLEIVPDVSPYAEPKPAKLPVRVIFEGKPLAGALVKMSNLAGNSKARSSDVTDEGGRAVFAMPSRGRWLLHVAWTKTLSSADEADFDTVFASLTFGFPT